VQHQEVMILVTRPPSIITASSVKELKEKMWYLNKKRLKSLFLFKYHPLHPISVVKKAFVIMLF
jgi:hypothetical protein